MSPGNLPLTQVRLNPIVLFFAVAVSLMTALIFGLAPAIQASRIELQDVLRSDDRSTSRQNNGAKTLQSAVARRLRSAGSCPGYGRLIRLDQLFDSATHKGDWCANGSGRAPRRCIEV